MELMLDSDRKKTTEICCVIQMANTQDFSNILNYWIYSNFIELDKIICPKSKQSMKIGVIDATVIEKTSSIQC